MTFEQKFAEFIQKNPTLACREDAKVTFTVKQLRQIAKRFFESGRDSTQQSPAAKSLFESIFG